MWFQCGYMNRKNMVNLVGILAIFLIVMLPMVSAQVEIEPKNDKITSEIVKLDDRALNFVTEVSSDVIVDRLSFTEQGKTVNLDFEGYDSLNKKIDIGSISDFQILVNSSDPTKYKWSYEFRLPDMGFVPKVRVLADEDMRVVDGKYIVVGEKNLISFEDVLAYDFEYSVSPVNNREVVVTFTKDWLGFKVGDMILIDPSMIAYPSPDGYLERDEFGVFDVYLTANPNKAGNDVGATDRIYRTYYKFNTSLIDFWDNIINATFNLRVSGETCGTGESAFWLQNISDFGDLGASDWTIPYQNITKWYNTSTNGSGWYAVNVTDWITKDGFTYYRIQGTYEQYGGVDCYVNINSNESGNEPNLEIYWTDGYPSAPNIAIHSPLNQSYDSEVISLNVSADGEDVDTWWYSLDSGSTNITFIPNVTIVASLGSNCVDVWLNSSYGVESHNQTCFTVDSYGTNLDCYFQTSVAYPSGSQKAYCNYSYAVNDSYINSNGICQMRLNTSVKIRRYTGGMDDYSELDGDFFGYSFIFIRDVSNVEFGLRVRCNENTTGNLTMYSIISAEFPFTNLNGTHNITSHNYTHFLRTISCDDAHSLYGVKGSFGDIITLENETWKDETINALNISYPYYGFYYGCPDCDGVANNTWDVAVDEDNFGETYEGNLSQTTDWVLDECGHEHFQWINVKTGWMNMIFNSSSYLYEQSWNLAQWEEAGERQLFFNCTKPNHESQFAIEYYNVTGATLPNCSIDSYYANVSIGFNQTFTWSANSLTPFTDRWVKIKKNNITHFETCDTGTFDVYMNETDGYTIECYVSNIVGTGSDSVLFTVGIINYTLELYYNPFVSVGEQTAIYGIVLLGGVPENPVDNLTIYIDNTTGDMVWVENISAYKIFWIPSAIGEYSLNVTLFGLVEQGLIKVFTAPYQICVKLWNNINMTYDSRYINEFAWIYAQNNIDYPTLSELFTSEAKYPCPPQSPVECHWHGQYINGTACIDLYEAGNYSFYLIGNRIQWRQDISSGYYIDCEFCPPHVIQQRLLLNLGEYHLNGVNETFDMFYSQYELYYLGAFFGGMTSYLWAILMAIIGIVFFLLILATTHSLKSAIAGLILAPTIVQLIIMFTI